MTARDDLALFSSQELAAGLARLGTRENGEEIARLVGAILPSERRFYRWAHEVVLLVSSVGPEVAERVRLYYGRDDETRALIAAQQEQLGRFLVRLGEPHGGMSYRLEGVVIDMRPGAPTNLVPAYLPPRRHEGAKLLDLASEAELRAALALLTPDESAREIAAKVYAIHPEEQVHYDWTHDALMMLSCVSDILAARIRARFAVLPEERDEIARQQHAWREFVRSRAGRREGSFDLDSVVYDRRVDD